MPNSEVNKFKEKKIIRGEFSDWINTTASEITEEDIKDNLNILKGIRNNRKKYKEES